MTRGQCDCCTAENVKLRKAEVTGVETYACAKCHGEPPRRCETNECDSYGECMNCGAWNGEICRDED